MALRHPFFSAQRALCIAPSLAIAGLLASSAASAQPSNTSMSLVDGGAQVVVGRYSTRSVQPSPAAAEPLAVVVQLSFPRQQVVTIGDAVRHTLLRTGFTLVEPVALAPEAARFLLLPLPESQRELGPWSVQAVLDVLLGAPWHWHHDPLQRRIWFTVAPAYAALTQPVSPLSSPATNPAVDAAEVGVVVTPVAPATSLR